MGRRPNSSPQTLRLIAEMASQPDAWRYGYELSKSTGLKSGTLYPMLMRLSDAGLLEAQWRPAAQPGRPPRHAYRLTQAGLAFAVENAPAAGAQSAPTTLRKGAAS